MIRIIAEAGINHCGRVEDALLLVDAAHAAGADAIKFQLYHTDRLVRDVPNRDLLKSCELTLYEHTRITHHCDSLGIDWMVSCFDEEAVDMAIALGANHVKVGSGELVNHGLLAYIGSKRLGLILSTGMATIDEIRAAVMAYDNGSPDYADLWLMHCVSGYPTPTEQANLKAIKTLKAFCCPVGFSDHTIGFDAAVAATTLGADFIERHIMLAPGCPDEAVSLTPENFRGYVATIRRTEKMLGDGIKRCMPCEEEMKRNARYRWHVPTDRAARREGAESRQGHPHGRTADTRTTS